MDIFDRMHTTDFELCLFIGYSVLLFTKLSIFVVKVFTNFWRLCALQFLKYNHAMLEE